MTTTGSLRPDLLRARTAVAVAFTMSGLAFASFLARTPSVRDDLGLSSAQLGLLLLCFSGGAVAGLPLSGQVVHLLGPARAVLAGALGMSLGLAGLASGVLAGVVWPAAVGLVLTGLGNGIWDVSMNVAGADVERRLGRSLLPRLHAAFSLGTVGGAAMGAAAAAVGVPLAVQLFVVATLVPVVVARAVRRFLPAPGRVAPGRVAAGKAAAGKAAAEKTAGAGVLAAWREPRTLVVGLLVLSFAFTEGTANDWLAVALVDGYGTTEALAAVGFGMFVSAMTVGRLLGGSLLDRFGRVVVLRVTAAVALSGLLLVVLGGSTQVALAGALLWGAGASLGFPVGMSAASDDPLRAAARVSVVGSLGYSAFLAGPPLIGLLAGEVGTLRALLVVVAALAMGLLTAGASRPVR